MSLPDLTHRVIFDQPQHLSDITSWHGLIPLAFALAAWHRPRVFVELGTHKGDSYCAFCQAVDRLGLDTACHAVDTWQGEQHAGEYGSDVLDALRAVHDGRYGRFSRLMQSTFDEAVADFHDKSIDLLHIDGLHTYEAVKHDFETWLPKMSARGIVLFHDISVRERDFGVWRLWQELSTIYPALAVEFSNGLGILGVGDRLDAPMQDLFALDEVGREYFSRFFHALGDRVLLAERNRVYGLRIEEARSMLQKQGLAIREKDRYIEELGNRLSQIEQGWQKLQQAKEFLENERLALIGIRDEMLESTSWRITRPLRAAARAAARCRTLGREALYRCGRLVYHGCLPLPEKYKQRLRRQVLDILSVRREAAKQASRVRFDKEAARRQAEQRLEEFLASGEILRIPAMAGKEAPKISVVIVLFNQAGLTLECLRALSRSRETSLETIVVDNASSDRTAGLIERIEGIRYVRNQENLHFLRAVNQAASMATGEYLLLLNNDAMIDPAAIERAVRRFEESPDIGAVGGRILLYDGSLQEAGSILWRDGSCLGYGRDRPPEEASCMFARDVDYCSGAFLMTPRALFERMGRFDERFAPAYYEETDYCASLLEAGYRIVYDPSVVVRHFEFASSTTSDAAIELQRRNQEKFLDKHEEFLSRQFAPLPANILAARQRLRAGCLRILAIDDRVPHLHLGSGCPRANLILRLLAAEGHAVTFLPLQFPQDDWQAVHASLPDRIEVMLECGNAGLPGFLKERQGYFDVVLVSRPHNMRIVKPLLEASPALSGNSGGSEGSSPRLIYDAEAVFAVREEIKAKLKGRRVSRAAAGMDLDEELSLAANADVVFAVSEAEARQFRRAGCRDVRILGHSIDSAPTTTPFAARSRFLFVGAMESEESPNADSILWFVREVWPLIRESMGERAHLDIVGLCKVDSIRRLAGNGIAIHGPVDSLDDFFDRARVFIVPTRFAAGIPHKAHEAAAHGVPMVVTTLIAGQLGWEDTMLASDDPEGFARHCVALFDDEALWQTQRRQCLSLVRRDCDRESFRSTLLSALRA